MLKLFLEKLVARERYLLKTYGINLSQYNELLKKQGGGCAICSKKPEQEKKSLAVDHDHVTGEIRGILCSNCNYRLVRRHRSADLLRRLADYVAQGSGWFVPAKKKKRKKRKKRR